MFQEKKEKTSKVVILIRGSDNQDLVERILWMQKNTLDMEYNKKLNEYKRKIGYINKKYPKITFHWCAQFPSSMKEVCPSLFKKMYF